MPSGAVRFCAREAGEGAPPARGGVAGAGSCGGAGLWRGKEPRGADRAAAGVAPARAQGGREGGGRQGGRCARLGVRGSGRAAPRLVFAEMKRPCEETTSESDMDETIDVGSENNYSG